MIVWKKNGEKLNQKVLDEFEKEEGVSLPESYKTFMLETNGGMPKGDYVFAYNDEVSGRLNHSVIQDFFVLYSEDNYEVNNLKNFCHMLWSDKALSEDMFPFAEDPAGNYLCFSLNESDYGVVYYCNHEYINVETEYLMSSKVADSFAEFINMLVLDE